MKHSYALLLDALRSGLLDKTVDWTDPLSTEDWMQLLRLAESHEILPLFVQVVFASDAFAAADHRFQSTAKKRARGRALYQAGATAEFELLYGFLRDRGLTPHIMKGIVLRNLYPKPELRPSVDEDLLIRPEEIQVYHKAMLDYGLELVNPDEDITRSHEVAYQNKEKHLYIEVHKQLFPPESGAYGDLNALFDGVWDRHMTVKLYGQQFETLTPTDHLLYLICHAYKHFLHSGVGVRQIADMALFANAYGGDIDWEHIYRACQSVNIETFTAALFQIANKHLTLKEIPAPFARIPVDEQPLLEDILSGGLYGTVDIDRVHSGNMTLDAVAAQKQGRRGSGVWHSLFPGAAYLKGHFPYAKKHPVLLPLAWAQRLGNYLARSSTSSPTETIRIGQARIDLLKQYKVI